MQHLASTAPRVLLLRESRSTSEAAFAPVAMDGYFFMSETTISQTGLLSRALWIANAPWDPGGRRLAVREFSYAKKRVRRRGPSQRKYANPSLGGMAVSPSECRIAKPQLIPAVKS